MEDDDWIATVLIGGVLSLLGFLVVPGLLVYGYVVRAIRYNLDGEPEPPSFGDWGELLVDGLQAAIIVLLYMLIPFVVMAVTVGGSLAAIASGSDAGAVTGLGGILVGFLASFVLALVFGYFSVVGVVNFAREERFGAGFDVDVLRDVGLDGDFAVPWLLSIAVFFAAGLVNVVPFVGLLIVFFTNFYAAIVATNLWADGFTSALDDGGSRRSPDVDEPAV